MAAASLVATAFGIVIIIITAYVLAGSTLATSEIVNSAQKDMTDIQLRMLGTSITVLSNSSGSSPLYIEVLNSGREPIRNFKYIDVYLYDTDTGWSLFTYRPNQENGHWTNVTITDGDYKPEKIFKNQWDPGEILNMSVSYVGITPQRFKIVTGNGISNY